MKQKTFSDSEILAELKKKSPVIFQYLYRKFGPAILAHIMKNSGSREDGEEILQRTVLTVWEKVNAGKYEGRGKFGQYFFSVAANLWLDELRRRRRKPIQALGKGEEFLADEGDEEWSRKVVKNDSLDALYSGLKRLGDACREFIELYYFQEIPLKEIAEQKQYNYGNLRKRIFDCRNKLKRLAAEELTLIHTR